MAQEIYNEGRVVGFSAWEIFARTALNNGVPEESIPNERQWLTAMIGAGASMVLKIPTNTPKGVYDVAMPTGSNLTAAGVIIANPFMGECEWDDISGWATKVTSYSPLAQNTSIDNPPDASGNIPADSTYSHSEYKNCVSEFAKITDGIVFTQDATWIETQSGEPYKDINPNFNQSKTIVRLYISSDIKYDTAVLLTGFQNKRILQGMSAQAEESGGYAVGGSTDTDENDWINGGMLGPEVIPWATKIVFCVPSSAYNLANSLTRTIPADADITNPNYDESTQKLFNYTLKDFDDSTVKPNSFIDFNSINLTDYYTNNSITGSTLTEDVSDLALGISDEYNELVAWYPGMTSTAINAQVDGSKFFPPALYAAQINSSGTGKVLVPIDVASPGTVKGFNNSTKAYNYTQTVPNTYALYYNDIKKTFSFVTPGQSDPTTWSGTSKLTYKTAPKAELVVGNTKADFIALTDSSGNEYTTDGTSGEYNPTGKNKTNRYYTWDNMFSALTAGQKMDILGSTLASLGQEMESNAHTIGVAANSPVSELKTSKVTLKDNNVQLGTTSVNYGGLTSSLMTLTNGTSIKVGTNFIEFSNGRRLFISESAPTSGMRQGDIGIGW